MFIFLCCTSKCYLSSAAPGYMELCSWKPSPINHYYTENSSTFFSGLLKRILFVITTRVKNMKCYKLLSEELLFMEKNVSNRSCNGFPGINEPSTQKWLCTSSCKNMWHVKPNINIVTNYIICRLFF